MVEYRKLQRGWLALVIGITAGYLGLVRPSFGLLLFFVLPPCVLFDSMIPRASRNKLCVFALIGFALCIAPWTIRNALVSKKFIPFTAAKGISLYVSAQQYKGELKYTIPLPEWDLIKSDRQFRIRQAEEAISASPLSSLSPTVQQELLVDRVYTADALEKFKSVPLYSYILNIPERMANLWSTCDVSPWSGGGVFHRIVQFQFLCVSLLIALGLRMRRSQLKALWPLWIVPTYVVICIRFSPTTLFTSSAPAFAYIRRHISGISILASYA
jgi:hypothetical protein